MFVPFKSYILFSILYNLSLILQTTSNPLPSESCPYACHSLVYNGICDSVCNIGKCAFDGGDCLQTPSINTINVLTLDFSTISGVRPISLIENLRGFTNQSINFVFDSNGFPKIFDIGSGRRIDPDVLVASGIFVTVELAADFSTCGIKRHICRFHNVHELLEFLMSADGKALFGMKSAFAYISNPKGRQNFDFLALTVIILLLFAMIAGVISLACCCRSSKPRNVYSSEKIIVPMVKTNQQIIAELEQQCQHTEQFTGDTVLHLAVINNLPYVIPLLLARGIDPNVTRIDGETPLSLAVEKNSLSCVEALLKATSINVNQPIGPDESPLKRAIINGNAGLPIVKALLNHAEIDVNAVGDQCNCLSLCQTPVHVAVICGNLQALKELIAKNANLLVKDEDQKMAIHYALERGNVEIIGLLMARNAAFDCEPSRY